MDRVELFTSGKKIATHERLYGNNKWGLDLDHYLDLLQQRPMAFNSARPIRQWRQSWPQSLHLLLERFCSSQGETKGIKDFITVLMFYRDYKPCEVNAAVELAIENSISASDGVRHILIYTGDTGKTIAPLSTWSSLPAPDVAALWATGRCAMTVGTLMELQANLKALNLSQMARNLEGPLRQARESGIGYDEFLLEFDCLRANCQSGKQAESPD